MTKREAEEKGYRFTGIGSRDRKETSFKAVMIRKLGYDAVVTTTPPDPYSRSLYKSNWYNVYTEKQYKVDYYLDEAIRRENKNGDYYIIRGEKLDIQIKHIFNVKYFIISNDNYSYIGKDYIKNFNIETRQFTDHLKKEYNVTINKGGIALFTTLEDAKNAADWIESIIVLSELMK